MIRIGRRAEDAADTKRSDLRGTVEHVGSGRREAFRDSRELLAFLVTEHAQPTEEAET